MPIKKRGMILGKFLPPHKGHCYLIDFARHFVNELTIVVGSLQNEPIPGVLRYQWMKELFPDCQVLHLADELPQAPSETPDFWWLWEKSLKNLLSDQPDYIFASETYGLKLAEVLGAMFVPVDPERQIIPVSGTAIRNNPREYHQYLPDAVLKYYDMPPPVEDGASTARQIKICLFGPESTGKSTLASRLAKNFQGSLVSEYARVWLEMRKGELKQEDMPIIAYGQLASTLVLQEKDNALIVCDTDCLTTCIWHEVLYSFCPSELRILAQQQHFDLTLLCDVDVPWVEDRVRYLPNERKRFFRRCQKALEKAGRKYEIIRGGWDDRWNQAVNAVTAL
jgi:NadR type nicotinamide-nucleotide adenylyltransferase